MNRILILAGICFFAVSCKTKKEMVTDNLQTTETNYAKAVLESCADADNGIIWSDYSGNSDIPEDAFEFAKLLTLNSADLDGLMLQKFQESGFTMFFPIFINGVLECKQFELQNSNTISREKQKSMGIFSFKGQEIENQSNSIRFDYTQKNGLQVYAFIDNGSYILEPIEHGGKKVYITYNKKDSEAIKQQFEISK